MTRWSQLSVTDMSEANLNSSGPEPGTTLFSAAQEQRQIIRKNWQGGRQSNLSVIKLVKCRSLPDPTAKMPDWGGFIMAQNCLIPKGPPKFDTVKVPPCKAKHNIHIEFTSKTNKTTENHYSYLVIFWFQAIVFGFLGQVLYLIGNLGQTFLVCVLNILEHNSY